MNLEQLRARKPEILAIAKENGISNIRVFGSIARGDADKESDVDLLVKGCAFMREKHLHIEAIIREEEGK